MSESLSIQRVEGDQLERVVNPLAGMAMHDLGSAVKVSGGTAEVEPTGTITSVITTGYDNGGTANAKAFAAVTCEGCSGE